MQRTFMMSAIGIIAAATLSTAAMASPACTTLPQSKWMAPAKMKARIAKQGYTKIKAFKTSGSCYEVYAMNKNGRRAEVYFNPVTGAIVQNNVD